MFNEKLEAQRIITHKGSIVDVRHRNGLSDYAEFSGKTLFLKFNTGPADHGLPASVGEAFVLKRSGLSNVKVWAIEGEGVLSAWHPMNRKTRPTRSVLIIFIDL